MTDIYKIETEEDGKKWDRLIMNISCKKASPKEEFDFYIKKSFIDGAPYLPELFLDRDNPHNFGYYCSKHEKFYDRYLSLSLNIEAKLSEEIRNCYLNGNGNEFSTGKYYSVASSSRFATACFSKNNGRTISFIDKIKIDGKEYDICNITFEKSLNVVTKNDDRNIISYPQMDVVLETHSDIYYFEVKCHEIFDNHKNIKIKWQYKESADLEKILPCINETKPLIKTENKKQVEYIGRNQEFLNAKDFELELKTYHFDFKQFICHLMGINNEIRNNKNGKKIHFYYLFYKNEHFEKIYDELENELNLIFNHFSKKFPNIEFGYLFHNKFDTLNNLEPIK